MKRKVIFLDIDGVLNPKWWERKPLGLLMLLSYYLTKLLTFPIGTLAMRIVEKEPVRESWGRLKDEAEAHEMERRILRQNPDYKDVKELMHDMGLE